MPNPPDDPGSLTDLDLDAWQPPAPPAGLTDRVLARMQVPQVAPVRTGSARAISAAAGATLVVAAAITFALVSHGSSAPPGVASLPPGPVASPAAPSAPLPAGSPQDDARVQALEKRVLELEVSLELLRAQVAESTHPAGPSPSPMPAVARVPAGPVANEDGLLDPFGEPHGDPGEPDDVGSCDPFVSPHGCRAACDDADVAASTGEQALHNGAYALALAQFQEALRCRPGDHALVRGAAIAACGTANAVVAHGYYKQLALVDKSAVLPTCDRYHVDMTITGTLSIVTQPVARVSIDNVDTRKSTPVELRLPPGPHHVTLMIGADSYTYPVIIREDEETAMVRDLR